MWIKSSHPQLKKAYVIPLLNNCTYKFVVCVCAVLVVCHWVKELILTSSDVICLFSVCTTQQRMSGSCVFQDLQELRTGCPNICSQRIFYACMQQQCVLVICLKRKIFVVSISNGSCWTLILKYFLFSSDTGKTCRMLLQGLKSLDIFAMHVLTKCYIKSSFSDSCKSGHWTDIIRAVAPCSHYGGKIPQGNQKNMDKTALSHNHRKTLNHAGIITGV